MTDPENGREKWRKDFEARGRDSGSILDSVRLTEPTYEKLVLPCSPGYGYDPAGHKTWKMACKRRNCQQCGWYWACKWRTALKEKARNDADFFKKPANKALTLTFAQNVPYGTIQNILRQFWKLLRRGYPNTEYWGVVEFNQTHSIPHLHFILQQSSYMELDFIDYCWKVAQMRYKLDRVAWNIRIEKIRKNTQAYFTKYITKLTGGKDEIPRRENWGGRFVRYSTGFFPVSVGTMMTGRLFNEKLKTGKGLDRIYWYVRKPLKYLRDYQAEARKEEKLIASAISAAWNPDDDRARGAPLPADDLFTGVGTISVFYNLEFEADFWLRLAEYNRVAKTGRLGPAF